MGPSGLGCTTRLNATGPIGKLVFKFLVAGFNGFKRYLNLNERF
jgi:hypothetical protein